MRLDGEIPRSQGKSQSPPLWQQSRFLEQCQPILCLHFQQIPTPGWMLAPTLTYGDMWLFLSCCPSSKMGIYVHSINVNCIVLGFVRDGTPGQDKKKEQERGERREEEGALTSIMGGIEGERAWE